MTLTTSCQEEIFYSPSSQGIQLATNDAVGFFSPPSHVSPSATQSQSKKRGRTETAPIEGDAQQGKKTEEKKLRSPEEEPQSGRQAARK
eukprot:Selendium_serpulae@DN9464_c0_g1_i1.p3